MFFFFLIEGAYYYHIESIRDFLLLQDSEGFFLQSIREYINIVFLASSEALSLNEELVSGPLFRSVVRAEHIFDWNMWESLIVFFELISHDPSDLFHGNTSFNEPLLARDAMFEKLFQVAEKPILDSLTVECLELICCTCFLLIKSQ